MIVKEAIRFFLLLAFFLGTQIVALGHYLWIEVDTVAQLGNEQLVKIYYGEYNEGIREVRGGRLEELEGIVCWVITPDGKKLNLEVVKEKKWFQVKFFVEIQGTYTIMVTNTIREVMDWSKSDIGIVKPNYYASKEIVVGTKKGNLLNSSYSTFVILPQLFKDNRAMFKLLFNNHPLARAKVFVHAPNEWSKEYSTDENGIFSFEPIWSGQYVVECIYKEKTPGEYKGRPYEAIRHRVTFTIDLNR